MRSRSLRLSLTALADGLGLMKLLDPGAVPDELFGDAHSALYQLATQASQANPAAITNAMRHPRCS